MGSPLAQTNLPAVPTTEKEAQIINLQQENSVKDESKGFLKPWAAKFMFTLISIKVWGLMGSMAVSTWLLAHTQSLIASGVAVESINFGLTGTQWVAFNTTIWTMLFGINEVKKAYQRKDKKTAGQTTTTPQPAN